MKKTFAAITLAATLAFGSTFTFGGIIISDSADSPKDTTCETGSENTGIIIFSTPGIIIFSTPGIIIFSSNSEGCRDSTGIIISD